MQSVGWSGSQSFASHRAQHWSSNYPKCFPTTESEKGSRCACHFWVVYCYSIQSISVNNFSKTLNTHFKSTAQSKIPTHPSPSELCSPTAKISQRVETDCWENLKKKGKIKNKKQNYLPGLYPGTVVYFLFFLWWQYIILVNPSDQISCSVISDPL